MSLPRLKIAFLQDPKDKPKAVVTEDFTSVVGNEIPRGFVFDGSTKLSLFWGLIHIGLGSFGEQNEASVEHDWIYVHDGKMPDGKTYTRKQCDKLFHEMLLEYGIHPKRAKKAYKTVRALGWIPWVKGDGTPTIMSEEELKELGL